MLFRRRPPSLKVGMALIDERVNNLELTMTRFIEQTSIILAAIHEDVAEIILYGLSLYAIIIGLWNHSWQLILAGVTVAVIWPLIGSDVEDPSSRKGTGSF